MCEDEPGEDASQDPVAGDGVDDVEETTGDGGLHLDGVDELEHPAPLLLLRHLTDELPGDGPLAPVLGEEFGTVDPLAVGLDIIIGGARSSRQPSPGAEHGRSR